MSTFALLIFISIANLVEKLAKTSTELRYANLALDLRIQQRTTELAYVNTELRLEVQERERAEKALIESEQKFLHSQKLESIGRLTGGIAHDFNNLLTVILSYCELSLDVLRENDQMRKHFGEIRNAAQRASTLTRQLLAFGRRQIFELSVFSFNDLITDMQPMLERLIGENIKFCISLDSTISPVLVDRNQLEQVLMNLIVNALDAMPEGGTLTLITDQVDVGHSTQLSDLSPGTYARLSVKDTGCGMEPAIFAHIFEPFFTTKDIGKGTGLGLSTAYGTIQQSRGTIDVQSILKVGTVFSVYLPITEQKLVPQVHEKISILTPNYDKTILVTEDEPQVREVIQSILIGKGYQVLAASEAEEALALSSNHPGPIHLLLTDFIMPQMNGQQLAEQMLVKRSDLKVLYMSGYANDMIRTIKNTKISLIHKPIRPAALLAKVQELL